MDSTAENDYFELEPYDQYKAQDVSSSTTKKMEKFSLIGKLL